MSDDSDENELTLIEVFSSTEGWLAALGSILAGVAFLGIFCGIGYLIWGDTKAKDASAVLQIFMELVAFGSFGVALFVFNIYFGRRAQRKREQSDPRNSSIED